MGFFSSLNGRATSQQERDLSAMEYKDLCRCFTADIWAGLSPAQRKEACQALEDHFAAEQGRPSKLIILTHFDGACYGCWSPGEDVIQLNESLVNSGAFTYKTLTDQPLPDASLQIFDTVAHEGYHAYQSYAVEHPEAHADKAQLREWRENDAQVSAAEYNYIPFDKDSALYRVQPLERDAFAYGEEKTHEAFGGLTLTDEAQLGYEAYCQNCDFRSYDGALAEARRQNPYALEDMRAQMHENCVRWGLAEEENIGAPTRGEQEAVSAGKTETMPPGAQKIAPAEETAQRSEAAAPAEYLRVQRSHEDGFLDPDESYAVKGLIYGGDGTIHKPSPREQYEQRIADIDESMKGQYEELKSELQSPGSEWTEQQAEGYFDWLQAQESQMKAEARATFEEQTGRTPEQTQGVSMQEAAPGRDETAASGQAQGASMQEAAPGWDETAASKPGEAPKQEETVAAQEDTASPKEEWDIR